MSQLKRIRWAVRAVLALGVAASICGNVLHARDDLIAQVISAWSPLALLLTVELISRVPVHRPALAWARWVATAVIAGIAAWVSYWHMVGVASRYGETGASPYLLPLSVDGLVVVASVSLVELAGRIRDPEPAPAPAPVMIEPANAEVKEMVDVTSLSADDPREDAREAYRASVTAGDPLSGAELARRFGMSARWGVDRVNEVRKVIGNA